MQKSNRAVRAVTTFTFVTAVVALGVASVFSWGNLFAAGAPHASDDPLTNRLAIVEPRDLTVTTVRANQAAANAEVKTLNSWVFTSGPPSIHR